jgi:hypothetical protein
VLKRYIINGMKNLKTFMTVIGWLGIICFLFGLVVFGLYMATNEMNSLAIIISPGTILVLVGGFSAKPQYFWPVLIVSGSICSILALIDMISKPERIIPSLILFFVGTVFIIAGFIIHWLRIRQNSRAKL